MPPKKDQKAARLASMAKITGKKRLSRWERSLLGLDVKFSPNNLNWTTTTPLNNAQWRVNAFTMFQKIWVVGGFRTDGCVGDIEIFDPASGTRSFLPYPFNYFGPALVKTGSGMLYAIGGLESGQTLASPVEEYNPATGTITQKAALLTPCHDPGIASTGDGKIYVMGGCLPPSSDPGGPPGAILPTVQIFNPDVDTWSTGKIMPVPRHQFAMIATASGKIYAIGGTDGHTELNRVDIYIPQTNSWEYAAPMPTARRCLATVLAKDGRIYAIGGLAGDASLATVEIYDPVSNSWSTATPLNVGRWYLGAATLGNKIYACGGYMRKGPYQTGNANVCVLDTVEEGVIL